MNPRIESFALADDLLTRMRKTASGEMVTFDKLHVAEVVDAAISAAERRGAEVQLSALRVAVAAWDKFNTVKNEHAVWSEIRQLTGWRTRG